MTYTIDELEATLDLFDTAPKLGEAVIIEGLSAIERIDITRQLLATMREAARYRAALEVIATEIRQYGTHCSWCGANLRGVSIGTSVTTVYKETVQQHAAHCPTIVARTALKGNE